MTRAKEWLSTHWHWAVVGYLILALGVVIGFYFLNQSRQALCALRSDLDSRIISQRQSVARGVVFLREHPHGAFGFTRQDIKVSISAQRRSLENSMRTRDAIDGIWCGGDS